MRLQSKAFCPKSMMGQVLLATHSPPYAPTMPISEFVTYHTNIEIAPPWAYWWLEKFSNTKNNILHRQPNAPSMP